MGGVFGVASKQDCVGDLFYGTDYHSHLGTVRGGLAVQTPGGIRRIIHDITNTQFRSKFDSDISTMDGNCGIGVISDFDDQPLIIASHLGVFAIVTVGAIQNLDELAEEALRDKNATFSEMSGNEISPTELTAHLISSQRTFEEGIQHVFERIQGSCSILILTDKGVYAARDRMGRTPLITGRKDNGFAVTIETTALYNLGYDVDKYLGPGEICLITPDGIQQLQPPGDKMQICSFLWVYYGYPSSDYENINVEATRNRCGAALARNDNVQPDLISGVPDSGTAHAIGYANESGIPYKRPFVKYTPTWPRSFMPQSQKIRDLVARMKLVPVKEIIQDRKLLFCEDSIVRGTQLRDTVQRIFESGAKEIHMRPACPPLLFGCKFLNFSRSRSEMDLAGRQAVKEIEGKADADLNEYIQEDSDKYTEMVERIRIKLGLTTLKYQRLDNLVQSIGMPKEKLCTYCWDSCEGCNGC